MLIIKYLRTTQKESIQTFHMELTRAAPLCVRYFQRLRCLAIVVSKKHRDWKRCKFCLAVKLSSPLLKNCGGVTMELVQKVIGAVGGVNGAVCASFLSQLEVFDEDM